LTVEPPFSALARLSEFTFALLEDGLASAFESVARCDVADGAVEAFVAVVVHVRAYRAARVFYPGLESSPYYPIASKQMAGFGSLVSFWVKGGEAEAFRVIDSLRIPRIGPSLGGVESLVCHPATLTFYKVGRETREKIGIRDELIRYAVGIEDVEDLIADLDQALAKI
jgi:cystathionine beta-lyase/cystathionine gamma-synthase